MKILKLRFNKIHNILLHRKLKEHYISISIKKYFKTNNKQII